MRHSLRAAVVLVAIGTLAAAPVHRVRTHTHGAEPASCVHTYTDSRHTASGLLHHHHRSSVTPAPKPWFKPDFIVPFCMECDCTSEAVQSLKSRAWQLADIVKAVSSASTTPFVVNVGAADGDGGTDDPTFDVMRDDASVGALLIDGASNDELFDKYPKRANVHMATGTSITPGTIVPLMKQHGVPANLTAFKVDIDSWDCPLVEAVLDAGYRPAVIYAEINTCFPPPLRFAVQHDGVNPDDYVIPLWHGFNCFYGCSLASMADIVVSRGYALAQVDGWDAAFVLKEAAVERLQPLPHSLATAYDEGYASRVVPRWYDCFNKLKKVVDHRFAAAAAALRWAEGLSKRQPDANTQFVDVTLADMRKVLTDMAPAHKRGGPPFPYVLAARGASDELWKEGEACE